MTQQLTQPAVLEAFSAYQRTRNFAENTIDRRRTSIGSFTRHIAPMTLDRADLDHVEEWLGTFASAATKHHYLSDLGVFYRWAMRRRLCEGNPTEDVDPVRIPRRLPRPVPARFVPAIIATAPDTQLQLMCALAALAGLRVSEISALTVDRVAIHTDRPHLLVYNGKGQKDRRVDISEWLEQILASCGRPVGRLVPVTPDTIGRRIAAHLRALGIDATAHKLRATFATEYYRVTRDLVAVGSALGHTDPNTTMLYVELVDDQYLAQVRAMFPRELFPRDHSPDFPAAA